MVNGKIPQNVNINCSYQINQNFDHGSLNFYGEQLEMVILAEGRIYANFRLNSVRPPTNKKKCVLMVIYVMCSINFGFCLEYYVYYFLFFLFFCSFVCWSFEKPAYKFGHLCVWNSAGQQEIGKLANDLEETRRKTGLTTMSLDRHVLRFIENWIVWVSFGAEMGCD